MTDDPPIRWGWDEMQPGPGAYLVLWYHHDGESHWCSLGQLRERIRFIRESKPDAKERLARLTAIPWSEAVVRAQKAYDEAVAPVRKAYDEAVAPVRKAYVEAVVRARKAYDEAVVRASDVFLGAIGTSRGNAVAIAEGREASA